MPTQEIIRIEALFMNAPAEAAEFEATITEHFTPRDHAVVGADGHVSYNIIPGEYVLIQGAPATFDPDRGWNGIECTSLGHREVIQVTGTLRNGLRVGLKRKNIPNV